MKQKQRMNNFVKKLLDDSVNEGQKCVVLGESTQSTNGINDYNCQNYETAACLTNFSYCVNHLGACIFSSNGDKCESYEKPNLNMISGCRSY